MWWLIGGYVIPVIITYLYRRVEILEQERKANYEDFMEVFCPLLNIAFMFKDLLHSDVSDRIARKIINKIFFIK